MDVRRPRLESPDVQRGGFAQLRRVWQRTISRHRENKRDLHGRANWSPWNPPAGINKIVFGNGTFLAMSGGRSQHGASGNSHLTSSTNGLDWTAGPSLTSNALLGGCYGQGTFVLVGAYGTIVQSADFISPQLEQSRFVDGRFEASVTGEVGRRYRIQTATNVLASNWRDLMAFTNSLPTRQFSDPGATNNPSRFYRVVSP